MVFGSWLIACLSQGPAGERGEQGQPGPSGFQVYFCSYTKDTTITESNVFLLKFKLGKAADLFMDSLFTEVIRINALMLLCRACLDQLVPLERLENLETRWVFTCDW